MSDCEDKRQSSLTAAGHTRRRFLKYTAFTAAGTSAVATVPALARVATQSTAALAPTKCPDVKIPMKEVEGKVAFITGGSSGIGLGIARAFADAGMKVVIGYRTKSHVDEAMRYLEGAGDRVHAIAVDVTDRPGMERAADETVKVFGKVHVLVNNAGVAVNESLSRTTYDDWDWVTGVNVTGVFNGVRNFLPRIQGHGEGGHIITTSSTLGLIVLPRSGSYSQSKFAVVGLMETLRAELADTNIGASVFCPGLVTSNVQDSSRNRPSNLSETGAKEDPKEAAEERAMRHNPEYALDPLEVGRLVLLGMRNNDLYILTSPEYEQIMRDRNEALMASIPKSLPVTAGRAAIAQSAFGNSIYSVERDRKLCAQQKRAKGKV